MKYYHHVTKYFDGEMVVVEKRTQTSTPIREVDTIIELVFTFFEKSRFEPPKRIPPKCPKCGGYMKGIYHEWTGFTYVGDLFDRWDFEGHICK